MAYSFKFSSSVPGLLTWQLRYPLSAKVRVAMTLQGLGIFLEWSHCCCILLVGGESRGQLRLNEGEDHTRVWLSESVVYQGWGSSLKSRHPSRCSIILFLLMGEAMSRNQAMWKERHKQHLWWQKGRHNKSFWRTWERFSLAEAQRERRRVVDETGEGAGDRLSLEPDYPWAFQLFSYI